jgi:hypothetical protein
LLCTLLSAYSVFWLGPSESVRELISVIPSRDEVDRRPKSEMNDPSLVPRLLNIPVTPDSVERRLVARELKVFEALERELLLSDKELVMSN